MDSQDSTERICIICGKKFTPSMEGDECCSAFCRTQRICQKMSDKRKEEESKARESLLAQTKPPDLDLDQNPKARVQWFDSLPLELRGKFYKFLSPQEKNWVHSLAQKRLNEDKDLCGYFVKNGRIVEVKAKAEKASEYRDEREENNFQDDDDNILED